MAINFALAVVLSSCYPLFCHLLRIDSFMQLHDRMTKLKTTTTTMTTKTTKTGKRTSNDDFQVIFCANITDLMLPPIV